MEKYKRLKKIRVNKEIKKQIDYKLFSRVESKDKTLTDLVKSDLQMIYFGQNHPDFDYRDLDLVLKIKRLARKHQKRIIRIVTVYILFLNNRLLLAIVKK